MILLKITSITTRFYSTSHRQGDCEHAVVAENCRRINKNLVPIAEKSVLSDQRSNRTMRIDGSTEYTTFQSRPPFNSVPY